MVRHIFGKRHTEGMFHLVVILGLICHFFGNNLYLNRYVHAAWVGLLIAGAKHEGLRGQQLAVTIPFILHLVVYVINTRFYHVTFDPFGVINLVAWVFAMVAWIHSVHYVSTVGCQDFTRIDSASEDTPYMVGVRHIKITDKRIKARVFYPMDRKPSVKYTAMWFDKPIRCAHCHQQLLQRGI